jgi:uncharacterized RDD family membrane protein YckC
MEYTGFWRRAGALFIDSVITVAISLILSILAVNSVASGLLIAFLYQPFFESSRMQGTPGKNLMGIRITTLDGGRISFKKAVIRFLVRFASGLLMCIGYLMALFTEKKQTLHDLAAETVVVMGEVKGLNMFEAWYQQVLSVLGMVDKVPADTAYTAPHTASYSASGASTSAPAASMATPADLAGLYDLYTKGILTEAEYNEKRAELLKKL